MPRNKEFPGDPLTTDRKRAWNLARSQARFRGEDWRISFQDYCDIWSPDMWARRGRNTECLVLMRRDLNKPWTKNNSCLVTRLVQMRIIGARRIGDDDQRYFQEPMLCI